MPVAGWRFTGSGLPHNEGGVRAMTGFRTDAPLKSRMRPHSKEIALVKAHGINRGKVVRIRYIISPLSLIESA
jgi:hypothetical protein